MKTEDGIDRKPVKQAVGNHDGGSRQPPGLQIAEKPETNIVCYQVGSSGPTASVIASAVAEAGVTIGAFGPRMLRMVTHPDISRHQVDEAAEVIGHVMRKSASRSKLISLPGLG